MNKCDFQKLRDRCRAAGERIADKVADDYRRLSEDPTSAVARLNELEGSMDSDFLEKLANGDHLQPVQEMNGLTNCGNPECAVCSRVDA